MSRMIWLSDDRKRDAQVEAVSVPKLQRVRYVSPSGNLVHSERLIRATEGHTLTALQQKFGEGEALARALVDGDPEIDLEHVGRKVGDADRVWMNKEGRVLYSARVLQVVFNPDGTEKGREDFVDVEATVSDEAALPWSGRLFPIEDVVRRFALVRKLQVRHVNGLTFDFLYEMAKSLHDQKKMLLVGSGPKGIAPLIFQTNGTPYRGFLEGRVKDGGFLLVLHLSNLELKAVVQP